MASPKTKDFAPESVETARLAKALGHPARIEILKTLIQLNACVCGTLVDALPLSQATVSQHLKALKEAGLVQGTISGPSVCYCVDPKGWARAQELLGNFLTTPSGGNSCC